MFQPTFYRNRVCEITPQLLREKGVKALALDVDNTLTFHGSQTLPNDVADWLNVMKDAGLELFIISNNNKRRVEPFARRLEVDSIYNAAKPLTIGLKRACRKFSLDRHEIMLVGDQLFTDILAANWFGCWSVLVEPIEPETGWFMRLKRRLEQPMRRKIRERIKS